MNTRGTTEGRTTTTPGLAGALLVAMVALAAIGVGVPRRADAAPRSAPPSAPRAVVVGCASPDDVLVVSVDTELDPSCTYTGGIEIVASDVTLDCRGARIVNDGPPGLTWGVLVHSDVDTPLERVTVRNCTIEGFLNNIKVTRDGFKTLAAGVEYDNPFVDILIERNTIRDSRGVGVYVDGYVTDVTIRDNLITGTGSSGIYLETGSTHSTVVDNRIVDNGYRENGPNGQSTDVGGVSVWFWGVGREGVAIDGARFNTIARNHFEGNSVGGIMIYKNCGEYPTSPRYFERRYGSHGNVIEENTFVGGTNGVWVGSRMAENTLPMECTDPAYIDEPLRRVVLDYASDNTIRANTFDGVTYGVRIEDDDTVVEGNRFTGGPEHHAVILGTPLRTQVLGRPVLGTVLRGNTSSIAGNPTPYRWVHGHEGTIDEGNVALDQEVTLCEGEDPPRSEFIFVVDFALWDPSAAPPEPPGSVQLPVLGPLEACPVDVVAPTPPVADPPPTAGTGATTATATVATPRFAG